jgi:hypothetical protein
MAQSVSAVSPQLRLLPNVLRTQDDNHAEPLGRVDQGMGIKIK